MSHKKNSILLNCLILYFLCSRGFLLDVVVVAVWMIWWNQLGLVINERVIREFNLVGLRSESLNFIMSHIEIDAIFSDSCFSNIIKLSINI